MADKDERPTFYLSPSNSPLVLSNLLLWLPVRSTCLSFHLPVCWISAFATIFMHNIKAIVICTLRFFDIVTRMSDCNTHKNLPSILSRRQPKQTFIQAGLLIQNLSFNWGTKRSDQIIVEQWQKKGFYKCIAVQSLPSLGTQTLSLKAHRKYLLML